MPTEVPIFKDSIVNTDSENSNILKKDLLVISDFFNESFADKFYADLNRIKNWNHQDTSKDSEVARFKFGYKRKQYDPSQGKPPETLVRLQDELNTQRVFDWIQNLSGLEVNGFVGSASWLRAGNYLASHNDCADPRRRVTFNIYLTKNWNSDWGGLFVYDVPRTVITPTYNTLVLFTVGDHSWHCVTPVSKSSKKKIKRLAYTGWFYKE